MGPAPSHGSLHGRGRGSQRETATRGRGRRGWCSLQPRRVTDSRREPETAEGLSWRERSPHPPSAASQPPGLRGMTVRCFMCYWKLTRRTGWDRNPGRTHPPPPLHSQKQSGPSAWTSSLVPSFSWIVGSWLCSAPVVTTSTEQAPRVPTVTSKEWSPWAAPRSTSKPRISPAGARDVTPASSCTPGCRSSLRSTFCHSSGLVSRESPASRRPRQGLCSPRARQTQQPGALGPWCGQASPEPPGMNPSSPTRLQGLHRPVPAGHLGGASPLHRRVSASPPLV